MSAEELTKILAINKIVVTTATKTLEQLGLTVVNGMVKLTIIRISGTTIYWNFGAAATTSTAPVPSGGASFGSDPVNVGLLQFIVASGTEDMTVIQEG